MPWRALEWDPQTAHPCPRADRADAQPYHQIFATLVFSTPLLYSTSIKFRSETIRAGRIAVEARNLIVLSSTPFIETTQGFPICIAMSASQAGTTSLLILSIDLCPGLSNNAMLLKNYIHVQKSTKRVTSVYPLRQSSPKGDRP